MNTSSSPFLLCSSYTPWVEVPVNDTNWQPYPALSNPCAFAVCKEKRTTINVGGMWLRRCTDTRNRFGARLCTIDENDANAAAYDKMDTMPAYYLLLSMWFTAVTEHSTLRRNVEALPAVHFP
jgi:hypothetical protein